MISKQLEITVVSSECDGSLAAMFTLAMNIVMHVVLLTDVWRLCPHWSGDKRVLTLTVMYDVEED